MANSRPESDPGLDERVLAGPVRTMGLALGRLEEESRALHDALARGASIVDLEPDLVDPSFVRDRLEGTEAGFAEFKRLIEERGQEVPILVRPHPDRQGRYQVAYGHRRLRAAAELGQRVRAVVRTLSDVELVVAQGVENSARQDLTYIEKALFARRLEDRGFERSVIVDALSTDKGELSKLISVARAVPEPIVQAVGPAPKAGRRRWLALAELLENAGSVKVVERVVREEAFAALDSDARFLRVFAAATPRTESDPRSTAWRGQGGNATARISRSGATVTLAINRDPAFGEFVASQLDELYASFRDRGAGSDPGQAGAENASQS
ncbi:plasmid partitioning protein RepB [Methylobacterium flocculans]|nr:plasmid partitioning protein RepB [Methylobacterium sp. FF17]